MDSKNAAGTHSREASVVGLSPSQKTKRRKTKTIYFDLFLLNVSILSKCSKRLSFKGVKFSVSERNCLIYRKASGECCTALAIFVHLKNGLQ